MLEHQQHSEQEIVILDDANWQRIMTLTGGAAALCYQCGACTASCPWGLVREQTIQVRSIIRQSQLGIERPESMLWLCTNCAQCQALCPRGVDISTVIEGLRRLDWEERRQPAGLSNLLWSIYWNNNPWSQPPSTRSQWAGNLDVPIFDPDRHEVLLYIGCTGSYDGRAQLVARALVKLLAAAGVSFGFLGDEEPCCGEAALSAGHRPYFEELAQKASTLFREKGVGRLVCLSPHCYDVFANHFPPAGPEFEPLHYTQYLALLLGDGRLQFDQSLARRVTFHDPCYLARRNMEIDAPRTILAAIPELELVEMERHGQETLCCGGGGGRMWLETDPGQRFADLRIQEAIDAGAEIVTTACPFCIACLEDSLKSQAIDNCTVMDVAELVALSIC